MKETKADNLIEVIKETEAQEEKVRQENLSEFYRNLGLKVRALFEEEDVIELRRNPADSDGRIWVCRLFQPDAPTEFIQKEYRARQMAQVVARVENKRFSAAEPRLRGNVPYSATRRLTIFRPPLTPHGITWMMRKPVIESLTLEKYLENKQITKNQYDEIIKLLLSSGKQNNRNILIIAPQKTGKTTFGRVLLNKLSELKPSMRMVIIEDALELEPEHKNLVVFQSSPKFPLRDLIPDIVRTGSDSLSIGELTVDASALVEAWTTGPIEPGIATVHGDTLQKGFDRIEQIILKEDSVIDRRQIAATIGLAILLRPVSGALPVVHSIAKVQGSNTGYTFCPIL